MIIFLMRDFTKYDVWKNSMDFVTEIYEYPAQIPDEENIALTSHIRQSCVSVPSNFAKGCSRSDEKDFMRFVEISVGSAFELKTQLMIAQRRNFMPTNNCDAVISRLDRTSKQLNALRNKLKN